MKRLALIFLLPISLLFAMTLQAQTKFGLRLGGSFATWTGDIEDLPMAEIDGMTAGHFGPYVQFKLSDKFAIEPALLASLKGASVYTFESEMIGSVLETFEQTSDIYLLYLDVPVLLRYYLIQGLNVYAGPQLSFHLANTADVAYEECIDGMCFEDDDEDEAEVTSTDFGAVFGVGYDFPFGFNINVGYDVGLADIDDTNTFETNNHVLKVSLGWTF